MRFTDDGKRLVVLTADGRLRTFGFSVERAGALQIPAASVLLSAEFGADSKHFVIVANDYAQIWDTTGIAVSPKLTHYVPITSFAINEQRTAFCTGAVDGSAQIWRMPDGSPQAGPIQMGRRVTRITFSPSGHYLAIGSEDGWVRVFDARTGNMTHEKQVDRFEILARHE